MNVTPRLRSAFPSTPRSGRQTDGDQDYGARPIKRPNTVPNVLKVPGPQEDSNSPLIPFSILDAPSQRLYISAFYLALTAWRLYDYSKLVADETDSLWLFMKWVAIDGVFFYGLPGLRVPWLEWSSSTMTIIFLIHAITNFMLMFRVPIPIESWLLALIRMIYDRELAVSERRVKPASLLHNSSLILGKKIVNILPEGSAMLNPEQRPFCIDSQKTSAELPILVNQTNPIAIELLRVDLETNATDTIKLPAKETKKMKKLADKELKKGDTASPRLLKYSVKRTGLYRLLKVLDESNLEVQRRRSDVLVVQCPSASVELVPQHKCKGELSNFRFEVDAVPPVEMIYSKAVNEKDQSSVNLTVHPEHGDSPLDKKRSAGALVRTGSEELDMSWAKVQRFKIPMNETLGLSGNWRYSIEELRDGLGNTISYSRADDTSIQRSKGANIEQSFVVHERPRVVLDECSPQSPLKVAKGKHRSLPVWFNPTGQHPTGAGQHRLTYSYAPIQDDNKSEKADVRIDKVNIRHNDPGPNIHEPGMYTLLSVSTDFCEGEILEPSSCLLFNPPEPDLSITSENIPDKCAGNSVGLRLSLDLIGTAPFKIMYKIDRRGDKPEYETQPLETSRAQLELKPKDAGHYTYEFLEISDAVYRDMRSLRHKNLKVSQDVKPTGWAEFRSTSNKAACIQEPVTFDILLSGESPWTLEYDLVHDGKRKKYTIGDIETSFYALNTPALARGGQHTLTLTSVTDSSGCKIFLDQQVKIDVRHQRPSASFGLIEGKRSTSTLEGRSVDLPVRLSGEPPWTIAYSRLSDPASQVHRKRLEASNDVLEVRLQDVYEIVEVYDKFCPGSVDIKANQFEVLWVPRPTIQLAESALLEPSAAGIHTKQPVCKGDSDALDLMFTGIPPYHIEYAVETKPDSGPNSVSQRAETVGLNGATIKMETSQAGSYKYKFWGIGDQAYEYAPNRSPQIVVQQKVYDAPSASFVNAKKTYSYCKEQSSGDEFIPIQLTGTPPFSLEMGIRHHSSSKPEIVSVPHVQGRRHEFHIPHHVLSLGTHSVTIRKVRDANQCRKSLEYDGPTIRVNVVDVPTISPMEPHTDFCVGDRISFALAGTPPFNVFYRFEGADRKAAVPTTTFRRIAERPGNFTITAISDKTSTDACRAQTKITKIIHELPSVRISKGRVSEVDIHEGGEAELLFDFGGTPPFEFTYTRSTNAHKGKRSIVLETKSDVSYEYSKSTRVSEEGTYEVISIRDRYCGVTSQVSQGKGKQQLLTFQ